MSINISIIGVIKSLTFLIMLLHHWHHGYTMHACSLQQKTEQLVSATLPQIVQSGMHCKREREQAGEEAREAEDVAAGVLYVDGTHHKLKLCKQSHLTLLPT